MELRLKGDQCPEFINQMISKFDKSNHEDKDIECFWMEYKSSIKDIYSLSEKLNEIISKLNNKESEYYYRYDVEGYKYCGHNSIGQHMLLF
jgi:hypothetical protein